MRWLEKECSWKATDVAEMQHAFSKPPTDHLGCRRVLPAVPPAALDASVESFLHHLSGAVQRALRLSNEVTLEAGLGPAAQVLGALVAQQSDVPVRLVDLHAPGDADLEALRHHARRLGLSLHERHVSAAEWGARRRSLAASAPALDSRFASLSARFSFLAQESSLLSNRLLLLRGAPGGAAPAAPPDSGLWTWEDRYAESLHLQLRSPFLDERLTRLLERVAASGGPGAPAALTARAAEALGLR